MMTRNVIDILFFSSIFITFPLALLILFLWSKKVWKNLKDDKTYSSNKVFAYMLPGILLTVLAVIPMFYLGGLRKADDHCIAIFTAPQPDYIKNMAKDKLKERYLDEVAHSCPRSNYDDLMSRLN